MPVTTGRAQIPGQFNEKALATELMTRLAGKPADGSRAPARQPLQVVWVDAGDEVLVHIESVTVRMVGTTLLVSIDLETDQTGRTPLVVALALSAGRDNAGLVAATDELPRGNGLLAARWGANVQAAMWAAILGIAQDHALQQGLAPRGLTIVNGILTVQAGPPLTVNPSSGGGQ